jgi:uncharacterized Ntn-hydrolase superfamily protein
MRLKKLIMILFLQSFLFVRAQDTFSILGIDTLTGEIGTAGASCIDRFLYYTTYPDGFITQIIPNMGAIATQAAHTDANQANAKTRMLAGDTPDQIINWLKANDSGGNPTIRQYGVVKWVEGAVKTAAFTGSVCMDYKNHIVGPNYTIHGNILLGKKVLDSMEAKFLREPGDLACKLMAAMQGANMVGADSRCAPNGSSSLFAFLNVSQPADPAGNPSLQLSLRTHSTSGIEPIDSLQKMFTAAHSCTVSTAGLRKGSQEPVYVVYPNPASSVLTIKSTLQTTPATCKISGIAGNTILETHYNGELNLNTSEWSRGFYILELKTSDGRFRTKIIKE